MRLSFDSIEEVKEFVGNLKGTRGGKKGEGDDPPPQGQATGNAPAPLMPPQGQAGGFPGAGFAPQGQGAVAGAGFPAAGAQTAGPAPEVLSLVQRINARIDWATGAPPNGGGQPPDQVLSWFRGQCGPETANYSLDQIKQVALPRMSVPQLDAIAKLMNAV